MAIRFTDTGQEFYSADGLPTTRLFTIGFWFYMVTHRYNPASVTDNVWWSMDDGTRNQYTYCSASGATPILVLDWPGNGNSDAVGASVNLLTWYKVAAVVNGKSATLYQSPIDQPLVAYSSKKYQLPSGALRLTIGDSNIDPGVDWPDARIASYKQWDAALTADELAQEFATYGPVRTANLNRWYSFATNDPTDGSGNGYTLSGGSPNILVEDGPPIT
jgi:hypothetical protein